MPSPAMRGARSTKLPKKWWGARRWRPQRRQSSPHRILTLPCARRSGQWRRTLPGTPRRTPSRHGRATARASSHAGARVGPTTLPSLTSSMSSCNSVSVLADPAWRGPLPDVVGVHPPELFHRRRALIAVVGSFPPARTRSESAEHGETIGEVVGQV